MHNQGTSTNDELRKRLAEELVLYAEFQAVALPRRKRILEWYAQCGNPDGELIVNPATPSYVPLVIRRDQMNAEANEIVDSFIVMRRAISCGTDKLDSEEFYTETRHMIRRRIREENNRDSSCLYRKLRERVWKRLRASSDDMAANGEWQGMAAHFHEVLLFVEGTLCVVIADIALRLGLDRIASFASGIAADIAL